MQERFGIAAFRSRQQALRLEAALKKEGLPVRRISTPREVAPVSYTHLDVYKRQAYR